MRRKSSVQTSREMEHVSNDQNRTGSKLARSASGRKKRDGIYCLTLVTLPLKDTFLQLGTRQVINIRYIIS